MENGTKPYQITNGTLFATDEQVRIWHQQWLLGDETARNQVIEDHIGLIYAIASKNRWIFNNPEDWRILISYGVEAMMKAWEKFDPSRGFKFSTFATYSVVQEIRDGLRTELFQIKVPKPVARLIARFKLLNESNIANSNHPSDEALLQQGFSVQEIELLKELPIVYSDTPMGEDESLGMLTELSSDTSLVTPATSIFNQEERDILLMLLGQIRPRNAEIIKSTFGLNGEPITMADLGRQQKVSRNWIRHLQVEGLRALRIQAKNMGYEDALRDFLEPDR